MNKSNMMVMAMMMMVKEKLQAIGIDDKMKNYVGPVRSQLITRPAVEVLTKIFLSFKKWLSWQLFIKVGGSFYFEKLSL